MTERIVKFVSVIEGVKYVVSPDLRNPHNPLGYVVTGLYLDIFLHGAPEPVNGAYLVEFKPARRCSYLPCFLPRHWKGFTRRVLGEWEAK